MSDAIGEIQDKFAEALVEASENFQGAEKNTTGDGGIMYMSREIEDVTDDTVRVDLTDVFNGNNVASRSYIPLSKTTPFAVRYITGYRTDRPIIVDKKKAYFDMREDGKFKEDRNHHYHGMGIDGFIDALEILNDPEFAILEEMNDGQYHYAFISPNENGEEICVVFQMEVTKNAGQMNGYPGGYYNLDITEFVATDEWLEDHGVEPGTSYKDYLLSFPQNSIAYDRSIHFEQMEKARNADSESAGLAASYVSNRASKDKVTQPDPKVKQLSDRDYMDAVNRGDMETVQRMVDQAAKAAGYSVKGFHATNADFTVFDIDKTSDYNAHGKGIYFTNTRSDMEQNYANHEGPDPWKKVEARAYELADEKYGLSYEDTLDNDPDIIDQVNECYDEAIAEFQSSLRRVTAYLKFENPLILKKGEYTDSSDYDLSEYDGIIDERVYETFGHSGMDEDTVHYASFKEKAKAIFTDGNFRDEQLSKLPALADELTWCAIWNAVKRETVSTHTDLRPGSEEFLKAAGERFTEVVTKTQVYDSVLARSANMRSKSGMMNMATSFMAEPTTTINMLEDAIYKAKRGNKGYAAKVFASVATSIVLNNALVALVYAMRDDDEDET